MRLVLKFDGQDIQEYVLNKESITIGRINSNDITIDNLAVSGLHASINRTINGDVVVDMKSTNGTFVNDNKIHQHTLSDGDVINVGKHQIIYYSDTTNDDEVASIEQQKEATVMMSADFQQKLQQELMKSKSSHAPVTTKKEKKLGFWGKFMKMIGLN